VGSDRHEDGVDRRMTEDNGFYTCLGVSCCLRSTPAMCTISDWLVRCVEDAPTKREPEVKHPATVISENRGTTGHPVL
jgi:hypothetical protein